MEQWMEKRFGSNQICPNRPTQNQNGRFPQLSTQPIKNCVHLAAPFPLKHFLLAHGFESLLSHKFCPLLLNWAKNIYTSNVKVGSAGTVSLYVMAWFVVVASTKVVSLIMPNFVDVSKISWSFLLFLLLVLFIYLFIFYFLLFKIFCCDNY